MTQGGEIRVCDTDSGYSFEEYVQKCRDIAERVRSPFAMVELAYSDYLRERRVILEHLSLGVVVIGGHHVPGDPTLEKQSGLDGLRRDYRADLLRYHVVNPVIRWLNGPHKPGEVCK